MKISCRAALGCLASLTPLHAGLLHAEDGLSEKDYFDPLPVVLTVSRLAQPLSDTPGAVTVIDRDKIRRSGARDITDVLRLVPGYLVSGWSGANPNAMYHAPLDDYGQRNLVMIDGRSVYSSFYLGDTHRGMMGVMLEDIDRIEVLRGSDSAAYGANAMFGVINIITRHTDDTRGGELALTRGADGIADERARIGWGDDDASFRLSAGSRKDEGYRNAYDDRRLQQAHFRGDLRPTTSSELLLEMGTTQLSNGEGFPDQDGNPLRTVSWSDWYAHGQWRQQLSASEELKLTANVTEERITDVAPYAPLPAILLDFGGRGRRYNLELQHQKTLWPDLRVVWGAGFKREEAQSKAIYHRADPVSFQETRLFGNAEWRLGPHWLVNAGLFLGQHSWTGNYAAPRLMVNFQPLADHTLRIGASHADRTPSLFELAGDVRYYLGDQLLKRTVAARGQVKPETLATQEVGYFGNFRDWKLTLDIRAYRERMKAFIDTFGYTLAPPLPAAGASVVDYANYPGLVSKGVEYQLRWQPTEATEIWLNQNLQRYRWDDPAKDTHLPPAYANTLALFQKLPAGCDLSLMYHTNGSMTWRGASDQLPHAHRLDVRLAHAFRLDGKRAETALTVQSANGEQPAYLPSQHFVFEKRAFVTLRLEI